MADGEETRLVLDLLSRTLSLEVASLLAGAPDIAAETAALGTATKEALTETDLAEIVVQLKQLCYEIELKHGNTAEQHDCSCVWSAYYWKTSAGCATTIRGCVARSTQCRH